jgi:pyrroline-5-carboxylate reductase
MKITFLGGGNMANALIGGLLKTGFAAEDIAVIELGAEARARLEQAYRVRCYAAPDAVALNCDALLLSVKPQQMRAACLPLAAHLKQQLVISIAAGLRLADLSRWLGDHQKLVRAMPNTPALIGAGVTGLYALPAVSKAERIGAERILQAVGSTLWLEDEAQMDAVTAISGSGPAYAFLFIEALQQAAAQLGFTPEQGRQLSIDTALGAARLAAQSDEPASVLRERVTSKGGTTEAALLTMAERGVKEGLIAGILAAEARGRALGEILGKDE